MRQLKAFAHFKPGECKYYKEELISNRKGFLYPATRHCILNMLWQADHAKKDFLYKKTPSVLNSIIIKTSHAGIISIKSQSNSFT
jgi:hypothetical protein